MSVEMGRSAVARGLDCAGSWGYLVNWVWLASDLVEVVVVVRRSK